MAELDPTSYAGIAVGIIGPAVVYVVTHLKMKKSEENNFGPQALKVLEEVKKEQQIIRTDVTELKTKMDPFWNLIMKNLPDMLHSPHTPEKDKLLIQYKEGTLTYEDAMLLRAYLEEDMREQVAKKEVAEFLGTALFASKIETLMKELKH